jgi:hypothetical protein
MVNIGQKSRSVCDIAQGFEITTSHKKNQDPAELQGELEMQQATASKVNN